MLDPFRIHQPIRGQIENQKMYGLPRELVAEKEKFKRIMMPKH